jgi:hypothetical protein
MWSTDGAAPTDVQLDAVATSSNTLAYAAGFNTSTYQPVILRFNGTTWTTAALARNVPHALELLSLTLHGTSAWALGDNYSAAGGNDILHSSGGTWSLQSAPAATYRLSAIDAGSPSRAFAVGDTDSGGSDTTFFDSFNGHSWNGEPSQI